MLNVALVAVTDDKPSVCAPDTTAAGRAAVKSNSVLYATPAVAVAGAVVGLMSIDSCGVAGKVEIRPCNSDST
jgi:hypothetical protein